MEAVSLDELDRRILYHLDLDSRQSARELAKKVRSNKDTVNYRMHRLLENKVIEGFTAHVDTARFGLSNIKTYIRFQDMDEKREKEFFAYLNSQPEVIWIVRSSGRWDALFGVWASSTFGYHQTLKKLMNKFSRNIFEKEIIHNINWFYYNRKWLMPEAREIYPIKYGGEPETIKFSESDIQILRVLTKNAKASFIEIAKKTGQSPQNVMNRVKALEQKKVITKYGVDLNYKKLGLVFCKTFISLHNINDNSLAAIYRFCEQEPKVFALTTTVGAWDLELEFEVGRVEEMMGVMDKLKRAFPEFIRGHDSIVITEQTRLNYVPPVKA